MKEDDLIKEKNYLGAYHLIKNYSNKDDRIISLGRLANTLLEEISYEKSSERVLFLKSILMLISKEVPGLSSIYERVARNQDSDISILSNSSKNLYDVIQGKKTISEGIIDSIESNSEVLKRNIDSINSRIGMSNDGNILDSTTNIITEGIDNFTKVLKNINDKSEKKEYDNKKD